MEAGEEKRTGHCVRWTNEVELSVKAGDVGTLRRLLRGGPGGGQGEDRSSSQIIPEKLIFFLMELNLVHAACAEGHRDIVRFILTEVAPWGVTFRDRAGGAAPLHTAARFGRAEIARDLLGYGASVRSRDRGGCTPRK